MWQETGTVGQLIITYEQPFYTKSTLEVKGYYTVDWGQKKAPFSPIKAFKNHWENDRKIVCFSSNF